MAIAPITSMPASTYMPVCGAVREVLQIADHVRARETREIADRIDDRDAGRGGRARHERGRQRPEERRAGQHTGGGEREKREIDTTVLSANDAATEKPTAPNSAGTIRCQRRSRRLSALWPIRFITTIAHEKRNRAQQADIECAGHTRRLDEASASRTSGRIGRSRTRSRSATSTTCADRGTRRRSECFWACVLRLRAAISSCSRRFSRSLSHFAARDAVVEIQDRRDADQRWRGSLRSGTSTASPRNPSCRGTSA